MCGRQLLYVGQGAGREEATALRKAGRKRASEPFAQDEKTRSKPRRRTIVAKIRMASK